MACETRKDSESLPVEEPFVKPDPFPLQETGDQGRMAFPPRRREDPPNWLVLTQLFSARIKHSLGNVSITTIFTYLLVAAMEILKVPKDKTKERDEMKTKLEEIKYIKLKRMEHYKWKLEEQIEKACENLFMISLKDSMEWKMSLITMKEDVFRCGAEIACSQKLVGRLESEARTAINWIVVQLTTVLVVIGMLCYWAYLKEDVETGTAASMITAGCLLGVAILCIRKAQALFDSHMLTSECKQVKDDLEKPMMDCLMYKHAVEDVLPEKQKILRVVDYEIPKCKTD